MRRADLLLSLMALLVAGAAHAERPSYSYVEGAYLHSEGADTDVEAQGPRVGLNISLSRAFYFTGEYDQQQFRGSDNKISTSAFGFGIHSLRSDFQMFLAATYERFDFNDNDAARDSKDEGYGLQLGFRVPAGPVELGADAKLIAVGPDGLDRDEKRYRGTLLSRLTRNAAAVFGYEVFDRAEVEQVTAGLRVYFNSGHDGPRPKKRAAPTS